MRTYRERDICYLLEQIDLGNVPTPDMLPSMTRILVLPHLWGRNLIAWERRERKRFRHWFWLPRYYEVLVLTPFGKKELADFRREEAEALKEVTV